MKRNNSFQPVVVYDAVSYLRQLWLAVEMDHNEIVWYICSDTTRPDLFVRGALIGQIGPAGGNTRLITSNKDPKALAEKFKAHALKWGATPEAIRLLGLVCPLTEEEERRMPKLARKEELKAAAKAAPVAAKKSAPVRKNNNVEVFEEARTRKREELLADKRRITVTDKGKAKLAKVDDDDKLAIMIASKTVGAAIETEEVAMRDISYAEKVGLIELS